MPLKVINQQKTPRLVIGVAAGKGGVGKSTLTVLLAQAFKGVGMNVGILDADLYGPSIRRMLPEEEKPLNRDNKIIPARSQGIEMMSMAFFKQEGEASVVRAPIANGIIQQFLNDVQWGNLDVLLIDFPPGTGDIQITLAQKAQLTGVVIISTPQKIAVSDVRKCIDMFEQVQVPIIGMVENMSFFQTSPEAEKIFIFGSGGGKALAREKGMPLLGEIPLDPEIGNCLDNGKSLFESTNYPLQDVIKEISQNILDHVKALNSISKNRLGRFELAWKEMP